MVWSDGYYEPTRPKYADRFQVVDRLSIDLEWFPKTGSTHEFRSTVVMFPLLSLLILILLIKPMDIVFMI